MDRDVASRRAEFPLVGDEDPGRGAARDPDPTRMRPDRLESSGAVAVAVVDDHPAVRGGLVQMLDEHDGLSVTGTAASAAEGRTLVERTRPRVVLLDYHLPDEDGLCLCLSLKAAPHAPSVVIYSAFADESLAVMALIAGADRLVDKSASADDLCGALRVAARSQPGCHLPLRGAALAGAGERLDPADVPILGMLAHGVPEGEIAPVLGVSPEWLAARRWAMLRSLQAEGGARQPRGLGAEGAGAAPRRR